MLYEQLAAALEEIGQRLRAVRALEDVVLLDANPGQIAPLGVDLVPQPGEFFLLLQEFRARNEPLAARNNRVMFEVFGGGVDDHGGSPACFGDVWVHFERGLCDLEFNDTTNEGRRSGQLPGQREQPQYVPKQR